MNIEEIKKQAIKDFQKKGGQATYKKYGAEHFRELGKKGMEKRWKLSTDEACKDNDKQL